MRTTGTGSKLLQSSLRRWCHAWAAALLVCVAAAVPAAAPAEPPMWVIRDADSTIYLFGTVHLLDPAIQWRTARVQKALDEATQLWVEVDIPPGGEAALGMSMLQRALSPAQPLSSRLTEAERTRLRQLLGRTPEGQALAAFIDSTKPWFATVMLGVTPFIAAGHDPQAGADMVLTRLARAQGDEIKALETAAQQLDWLASGTEEEQLTALKKLLAVPPAEFDAMIASMDESVRAWMQGDTQPLEDYIEAWRKGDEAMSGGLSYAQMIAQRNENWAGQLAELLQGRGVAFVAVGGGHLVGPDSLQAQLAARGIRASKH